MTTYGVDRSGAAGGSGASATPIDQTIIDAKGDLIAGTADNTAARLAVGADNTRLVADSTQTKGLKYVADTVNTAIDAKGDLLAGTADNTVAPLAVGANNTRLVADSAQTTGLKYVADTVNTVVDAKGDLLAGTADNTVARLAVGTDGQVLSADSTQSTGMAWGSIGFSTGDVKLTIKTVADSGWVLMNDTTIGDASSGATGRANADTSSLFALLWANTADADCAVSTGRGGSAAADYAAHKTIALPKALGRALATYGTGSGLTARAMAKVLGVETHPLTIAELAAHTHTGTSNTGVSATAQTVSTNGNNPSAGGWTSDSTGSGTAHQNMQPTLFLNTMIKL